MASIFNNAERVDVSSEIIAEIVKETAPETASHFEGVSTSAQSIARTAQWAALGSSFLTKFFFFYTAGTLGNLAKAFLEDAADKRLERLGTNISESLSTSATLKFQVGPDSFADHAYEFLLRTLTITQRQTKHIASSSIIWAQ